MADPRIRGSGGGSADPTPLIRKCRGSAGPRIRPQSTDPPNFTETSNPGYGLEYIHKLDGTPYAPDSFANYYGTLYKPSDAHFYDYDSITSTNLDTPNYSSPYTYQQTFELPAGESKIEIIFDSVFNFLNGGAYYDIEISYT